MGGGGGEGSSVKTEKWTSAMRVGGSSKRDSVKCPEVRLYKKYILYILVCLLWEQKLQVQTERILKEGES